MKELAVLLLAAAGLAAAAAVRRTWFNFGAAFGLWRTSAASPAAAPAAAPAPGPAELARRGRVAGMWSAAAGAGGILIFLVYALSHNLTLAVSAAAGGLLVPGWWWEWRHTRTMQQVSAQLDQVMGLLTSGLRQGAPIELAFREAAAAIRRPLGDVMAVVGAAATIGIPFDEALESVRRLPAVAENHDFQIWLTQMAIGYRRGTNVIEAFEVMRKVLTARRRHRDAVRDQMGQHLVQGLVIMGIGLSVLIVYASATPEGLRPLVATGVGRGLLLLSIMGNLAIVRLTHVNLLRQLRRV